MLERILVEKTNTLINFNRIENVRIIETQNGHAVIASTYSRTGSIQENNKSEELTMNYALFGGTLDQCKHVMNIILTTQNPYLRIPSDIPL